MFQRLTKDVREMVTEQFEYRELLYQMTMRDLLLRYKQTVMGFGWALFMPLVNTAVFCVVFMRVTQVDTGGIPYPLYAFTGLLVWNFFASSLRFAVNSLSGNAMLVGKVYFPREIFPFSTVVVAFVDFLVASVVLVAMLIYYQTPATSAMLFLPLVLGVQVLFTAGVSLMLAMANLFYRDVKYLFEVAITVWMFATSVVYPIEHVGGRLGSILLLNPMTPIVEAYRDAILRGQNPLRPSFLAVAALAVVTLAIGWLLFHRAEYEFAENV